MDKKAPKLPQNVEKVTKEIFEDFKKSIFIYFEVEQFCGEPNESQFDIVKNLIGPELKILYNLLNEENSNENKTISNIFNVLDNFFDGKLENFIVTKFLSRHRKPTETFKEFYSDLEKLGSLCKFGDQKDKILKAQLILNINDKVCRKKIIEQNLGLDEIVTILEVKGAGDMRLLEVNEASESENNENLIKLEPKVEILAQEEDPGPNNVSEDILEPKVIIKEEINFDSDENENAKNDPIFCRFNLENSENVKIPNQEKLSCDQCSKNFKTLKLLKKHIFRQHIQEKNIEKLTCSTCQKIYSTPSALKTHEKIHLGIKNYVCDICSKAFMKNHDLQMHLRRHKGDRDKECEICHYKFYRNTELVNHMKTVHSENRSICCEICGKQLKSKNHLIYHMRTHSGERPYQCDLCPKAFSLKTTLKNHRLIHTGERNHICDLCGRGFTEKGQLRKHWTTHRDQPNLTSPNLKPKFNKRNLQYSQPSTS